MDIKYIQKPATGGALTPEEIVSKLFYYHNCAHIYHLATTSYAKHKMLDKLYTGLEDLKDTIAEYLLGIQAPKRFPTITLTQVQPYSDDNVTKMLDEGFQFSIKLCEYAESKNLEQLCNLSSELQGLIIKCKYLNTLK